MMQTDASSGFFGVMHFLPRQQLGKIHIKRNQAHIIMNRRLCNRSPCDTRRNFTARHKRTKYFFKCLHSTSFAPAKAPLGASPPIPLKAQR